MFYSQPRVYHSCTYTGCHGILAVILSPAGPWSIVARRTVWLTAKRRPSLRRAFFALWSCDRLTPWYTWPVWLLLLSWLRILGSFCGTARSGSCLARQVLGGTWCTGRALWPAVVFPAVCGSSLPSSDPGPWAEWRGLLGVATPPALAS